MNYDFLYRWACVAVIVWVPVSIYALGEIIASLESIARSLRERSL